MNKLPKSIYAMIIVAVLVIILLLATSYEPKVKEEPAQQPQQQQIEFPAEEPSVDDTVADVEPVELPDIAVVEESVGFAPKQVDRLTDEFVIRNVETSENKVSYYYQKHLATSGDRLILNVSQCSEEEYNASLPTENFEFVNIGDITAAYAKRLRYYLVNEESYNEPIQNLVNENIAIVEYGSTMDEVSGLETLTWYQDGMRFEIYALNKEFGMDKIVTLADYYINN